jgi:N-acetylglutamate synthase-like GNAT family acetyltransferase
MIIRHAGLSDVPWLIDQLRAFDRFTGMARPNVPDDKQHARDLLETLIAEHVFLMATARHPLGGFRPFVPVGFIAGTVGPNVYNPTTLELHELFWWVSEEHRGSSAGARLLAAFEHAGRDRGVHRIWMTLEAESPVRSESLERRGFRLKETNYVMELR